MIFHAVVLLAVSVVVGASKVASPDDAAQLYALAGTALEVTVPAGVSSTLTAIPRGALIGLSGSPLSCVSMRFASAAEAGRVRTCVALRDGDACAPTRDEATDGGAVVRHASFPAADADAAAVPALRPWRVTLSSSSKAESNVTVLASEGECGFGADAFAAAGDERGVGSQQAPTVLTPGLPLPGGIASRGGYAYYSMVTSAVANSRFTFAVTPLSGDPDIYVGTSVRGQTTPTQGVPSSYCWSSTGLGRDVVEIQPSDPCYCNNPQCTYYIGVYNAGFSATLFTILGTEGDATPTTLTDGQPVTGIIAAGETDRFTIKLDPLPAGVTRRSVVVTLTPFLGDPDLYVSFANHALPGPPPAAADYSSLNTFGPDIVVMRDDDSVWVNNAVSSGSKCRGASTTCEINIAVIGFSPAIYTIVVSSQAPVQLQNGVDVLGSVDAGFYTYYSFTAPGAAGDAVFIALDPLYGDPDMFVATPSKTTRPTSTNYTWRGISVGPDLIQIESTDKDACGACTYYIGVTGFMANASFTISARTRNGTAVPLSPGVPVLDVIEQRAYARYTAILDRRLGYLEISVSPTAGDPDLYVSFSGPPTTAASSYDFASLSVNGDEDIRAPLSDQRVAKACPVTTPPTPCIAYIAVFGYPTGGSAQYTITASNGLRMLVDGLTTVGQVPASNYTYFALQTRTPPTSPIKFVVTTLGSGSDPDVFVSTSNPRPTAANRQWASTNPGVDPDVIVIDPSDSRILCPFRALPCIFYVGVYAWGTVDARFTITGSTAGVIVLAAGSPSIASVAPSTFTYFSLSVPPGANLSMGLEFSVTPISGAADAMLYVGNVANSDPNSNGQTLFPRCADTACNSVLYAPWDSGSSLTRQEVIIDGSDPGLVAGVSYIVGVYSINGGARVAVQASYGTSYKELTDGIPAVDSVGLQAYSYFRLTIFSPSDVRFTLTPMSGDSDLYVSIDPNNRRPTRTSYSKAASTSSSADVVSFAAIELESLCKELFAQGSGCSMWVGVFGFTASAYTLLAAVTPTGGAGGRGTELLDGVPQGGMLSAGSSTLYFANVAVPMGATYSFYVRSTAGDADLYVTTDGTVPKICCPPNYAYSSTAFSSDDFVNVQPNTDGYNTTTRAFALVNAFSSANYTITFSTTSSVSMLINGGTVTGYLQGNTYAYWALALPSPRTVQKPVTFSITARTGDPDAYVMVWPPAQPRLRPTDALYTWRGESFGSDVVTIAPLPTDLRACHGARAGSSCAYIIGVKCAQTAPCRYSLTGSIGDTVMPLVDGEPLSSSISAQGQYAYFSLDARGRVAGDTDVVFLLSSLQSGGTSLRAYVTNQYDGSTQPPTGQLPTASSSQWSDILGTVAINASSSGGSLLFTVGVFWPSSSPAPAPGTAMAFTLSGTTSASSTALLPGTPSAQRTVSRNANQRFYALLSDLTQDLVFTANVLSGSITIAVSPYDPRVNCTAPRTCSPTAVWTSVPSFSARLGSTVRVFAPQPSPSNVGPCTGPYVSLDASPPCTPRTAWRAGLYYVAVYGVSPSSTYTLTFQSAAAYTRLADGVPAAGQLSSGTLPPVFAYAAPLDLTFPDVRFVFSLDAPSTPGSRGAPFYYYLRSCVADKCTPSDQTPSQANALASGLLQRGSSSDFFITKFSPAYCAPSAPGSSCEYFVSLVPSVPSDCPANIDGACGFTVQAQLQSGAGRTTINFASIDGSVAQLNGNIPPGRAAYVELYLDDSVQVGADITIDVDACGPGFPTLYVCNPASKTKTCAMPSQPGPDSPTASPGSTNSAVTFPSGSTRFVDKGVQGVPAYFLAVSATPSGDPAPPPAAGTANWEYSISISSGNALYLSPPSNATLSAVTPTDGSPEAATSLIVSWPPAVVVDQEGKPYRVLPRGVAYNIYVAQAGFNGGAAAGSGTVATTACGLVRWSLGAAGAQPQVAGALDASSAIVGGLLPSAPVELNVLALCDKACWAATLAAMAEYSEEDAAAEGVEGVEGAAVAEGVEGESGAAAASAAAQDAPPAAAPAAAPRKAFARSAADAASDAAGAAAEAQLFDAKYGGGSSSAAGARGLASRAPEAGAAFVPTAVMRQRAAAALARLREGAALGVPGYVTQKIAYVPLTATTTSGSPPSSGGLPFAAIVGLGVAALAALAGGYVGVRYLRSRSAGASAQYSALDISSAMATISVRDDYDGSAAYSSSLNGGSGGGGGGSGWRKLFGGGGGGGGRRSALADTVYSAADDAAGGYM